MMHPYGNPYAITRISAARTRSIRSTPASIKPGESLILADVTGPGVVQRFTCSVDAVPLGWLNLRVIYDDRSRPSILVPLGHFFANGLETPGPIDSLPIHVDSSGSMEAYWPMPYHEHLKLEIENAGPETVHGLDAHVIYSMEPIPEDTGYLHAAFTQQRGQEPSIVEGISGEGHLAGIFLLTAGADGTGAIELRIDGDTSITEPSSPQSAGKTTTLSGKWTGPSGSSASYRWYLTDPIRFSESFSATVAHTRAVDTAATAFWYQYPNDAVLNELPPVSERRPR